LFQGDKNNARRKLTREPGTGVVLKWGKDLPWSSMDGQARQRMKSAN